MASKDQHRRLKPIQRCYPIPQSLQGNILVITAQAFNTL